MIKDQEKKANYKSPYSQKMMDAVVVEVTVFGSGWRLHEALSDSLEGPNQHHVFHRLAVFHITMKLYHKFQVPLSFPSLLVLKSAFLQKMKRIQKHFSRAKAEMLFIPSLCDLGKDHGRIGDLLLLILKADNGGSRRAEIVVKMRWKLGFGAAFHRNQ